MADARKRSRRSGRPGRSTPEPAGPPDATPATDEPPQAADAASGAAPSIVLPPSGLASDVLAQPEAAAISPEPAAPSPEVVERASPAPEDSGSAAEAAPSPGAQSLSFFTAPDQEQRAATEDTEHIATFVLDREEYGVDVRQVQEIRRVGEITAVPRAPEFVRGVINLRGRILPVLDLKRKLNLGEVGVDRAARIVVVRTQGRMLGLLVDGASQVLKVPVSRVEPPPEEVVERGGDYIRAVAKLDDRLIILIDLERILAQELREAPVATGA
jgi:purine-binding chemotaxis protein CheW